MVQTDSRTEVLRERLAGLLADWGAEFSSVLDELEHGRERLGDLEAQVADRDRELERIAVELDDRQAQLEDRQALIRTLRAEADEGGRAKAEAKRRDEELARLKRGKLQAEDQVEQLLHELRELREASAEQSGEEAELEAVRAELEARKTLIRSLRADAERMSVLESRLEEKQEIIEKLEASINRHASTIADLKRSAEHWKGKYRALAGEHGATTVNVATAAPVTTDAPLLDEVVEEDFGDRTIAIDMREALIEARRAAAGNGRRKQ